MKVGSIFILYDARRYDEAIEACKKTLEMDPTFMPAHLYLSWIYEQKGMHAEEIAEEVKTMTMAGAKWNVPSPPAEFRERGAGA